jgi:hypothetical protein
VSQGGRGAVLQRLQCNGIFHAGVVAVNCETITLEPTDRTDKLLRGRIGVCM